MILVDTSIWIDHFSHGDARLSEHLTGRNVLVHPFVVGEIALGAIPRRRAILRDLLDQRRPVMASHMEVLTFIERHRLFGTGIGYVDAHLLASAYLTPEATLWTRDKRLRAAAERLGVAAAP